VQDKRLGKTDSRPPQSIYSASHPPSDISETGVREEANQKLENIQVNYIDLELLPAGSSCMGTYRPSTIQNIQSLEHS